MKGLNGKVALVTGAAGGMGRQICRRLVDEGCSIAMLDIDKAGLESLAADIGGAAKVFHIAVDISDYSAVCKAVDAAEKAIGSTNLLVNNAGWDKFSNFLDTDEALRQKVISINLNGPVNMFHAVLTRMAQRDGGRVVTIASDAGRVGSSGQAVYSACKGGVIALTKTLARELARRSILLNAVCPGPTDTPMLQDFLNQGPGGQKVHDAMKRAIPLKRLGQPDDIPGIVAFLLSDDASFITGQVISVSGGLTMHG
ncbi:MULTISPECIES: glucose 1-dehydrogenase [unclassified Afipia]|uniref:glucose 1-dehydrogenase n=1 Tax=unclassified Afipia TaxID=2642050 RepID=UPI00040034AE|nr:MULTISPECIES: glucose 1-dehydrogenase [unclassified Afipia]